MHNRPATFDLSASNVAEAKGRLAVRAVFGLAALVSGSGLAYIVFDALTTSLLPSSQLAPHLILVGLVGLFFAVSVYVFLGFSPGAGNVTIDSQGVTLAYQRGRTRTLHWTDPRFKLRLSALSQSNGTTYDLAGWIPLHNPLAEVAYTAVLAGAKERGLSVASQRSVSGGVSVVMTVVSKAQRVRNLT